MGAPHDAPLEPCHQCSKRVLRLAFTVRLDRRTKNLHPRLLRVVQCTACGWRWWLATTAVPG